MVFRPPGVHFVTSQYYCFFLPVTSIFVREYIAVGRTSVSATALPRRACTVTKIATKYQILSTKQQVLVVKVILIVLSVPAVLTVLVVITS